ncbi:MAG: amino acid adenylation domain-containing protein, partial [Acidobacteriota bacterium]
LLGVLKAGGAYVPLDPAYPAERLRYMVEDSGSAAVLTEGDLKGLFSGMGLPVLDLRDAAAEWGEESAGNPDGQEIGLNSEHLAYVIYTSGSTGTPKGVMIEHRGLCNLAIGQIRSFAVKPDSIVLQFASFSFDACISEILMALSLGASLRLIPQREVLVSGALVEFLEQHRITHATLPPAVLEALPELREPNWQGTLIVAGDRLPDVWARRWSRACRLINAYGPTEATVCATLYDCATERLGDPPIGKPIANTRIYILDGSGEPVPVGVRGELYIGGAGVARGYLNRPELTAERFLKDPFVAGGQARMYRSGDLGRWLPDGNIEFLGRNDYQVKIRGFRIEVGEIETRLAEHEGVREAAVLAREDTVGDRRLVAYYTCGDSGEGNPGAETLRRYLAGKLPEYMVPAAYVRLEKFPLTQNGKLDRKALPAPDGDAYGVRGYEAPVGEIETAVAEIWAEVLKIERVGRHDNFFELGGHSLLAVRAISRLREALNVEVAISDLFAYPVLAELARAAGSAGRATLPPVTQVRRDERVPLSFAQQRLWFLAQMEGVSEAYHIPLGLRLEGSLDAAALRGALDRIVARHEALRTTFVLVEGEPVQRIVAAEQSRFPLKEHDLRGHSGAQTELDSLIAEEAGASFDLEAGPLIRGRLIRMDEEEHTLLITMHHIVSDGWSMGVLTRELNALYGAFARGQSDPLPEPELQYADYALWQRKWIEGDVLREQAEYWKTTLAGAPAVVEVAADHARPAQQDYAGAFAALGLDEELTGRLKDLSRRHGTTLYMTLLAGWAVLLSRLSGQEDVVIGTPVANRSRVEIENLIGFFVNTLALRLDVSGSPTVGELLDRVKGQALAGQQHQDIPFEQVVEITEPVRSLSHSPLFQVMFAWQNAREEEGFMLSGLRVKPQRAALRVMAKFDLTLTLREAGGRIVGGLEYATALFERATVERYLGYFRRLLEGMAADGGEAVDRLPMLSEEERGRVLYEWNRTEADYPRERCVHELFEEQVKKTPDAVAVEFEEESLSYGELNRRANRLAHYLRGLGVKPDARVAICAERGFEMVVALLGVLKAGGAYVPLDPAYPAERLRYMVEDSGSAAVLTGGDLKGLFSGMGLPVLDLRDAAAEWGEESAGNPDGQEIGLNSEHLAYVIYTSGSTGIPKGVMIEHRAINRLVLENGYARFKSNDRVAFASSPAFDAATMEVWAPLLNGGRIVIIKQSELLDPARLGQTLRQKTVNVLWLTVGLFNQYADILGRDFSNLRYLIVGGDVLDPRVIAKVLHDKPPKHLINGYGPTETTTFATTCEVRVVPENTRSVPIGKPIANTRIYILDGSGEPVPVGVRGELYIGGAGVARGYLNRPELTAERFLKDPFVAGGQARMYRSGDLGRWLPDGNIEFLGRNDYQVKIRGFRIEVGE